MEKNSQVLPINKSLNSDYYTGFDTSCDAMFDNGDSVLETKKNQLLVAVYEKDHAAIGTLLKTILSHVMQIADLSENDEKSIHQILTIFKRFEPSLSEQLNVATLASFDALKAFILKQIKTSRQSVGYQSFSQWKQDLKLNPAQQDLVFKTAMAFQLTSGCSHFCRRCNEWALPGIRSHFSLSAIFKILAQIKAQGNSEISLYGASDPLDWEEENCTLVEIIKYIQTLSLEYSLLTKVPKGKKAVLTQLLKHHANLSISVTAKNKHRIQKIEADLNYPIYKQHDSKELLIPARLDEDFSTIKASITDGYGTEITPGGASIIIPTFTSALHPFGHKKIAVTRNTEFFPVKKTGRHALLIDYFKPLKGYDLNKNIIYLDALLDVQIESIILDNGQDELTPPGMRSLKEFLSIFDDKARHQRKKMTSSVLKKLKKRYLSKDSFKDLPQKEQQIYLKKIRSHLDQCKPSNCQIARQSAISFFLNSVHRYILKNRVKHKILLFLLKQEMIDSFKNLTIDADDQPLENYFIRPDSDVFKIFRISIFHLLKPIQHKKVLAFIKDCPGHYDPVADLFIQKQSV
ncbi:MAG: hypothetical protein ABIJ59_16025 [Pseudomonadota bacterium]